MEFYSKELNEEVNRRIELKMPQYNEQNKAISTQVQEIKLRFKIALEKTEKKYLHDLRKPFCRACARRQFKMSAEHQIAIMEAKRGSVDFSKLGKQILENINLETYADPKYFRFEGQRDAMEPIPMAFLPKEGGIPNVNRKIKIGVHKTWRCKEFNHGISIFFSNEELEKSQEKPKEIKNQVK